MGLITDLTPINYHAEKQRFLADPTFNPQFRYSRKIEEEELVKHGLPSDAYKKLAQRIIDTTFEQFTRQQLQEERGALLTQETVTQAIETFLKKHALDHRFSIVWSSDFMSRAAVSDDNTVKLRLPCAVREEDLDGLIYHEIGTHALRRINYEQQPWYKRKKYYGFAPYLKTEEGLATLHALFPKKATYAYRAAIYYLAAYIAQEGSFLDVWRFVKQYLDDPEVAFTIAAKKKRGLTDTSKAGGYSKDYVYFEGFAETTRFLIEKDFPLKELYYGKMSWQDVDRARELNPDFQPILPNFYTTDPAAYKERVLEIARANFLV